MTLRIVSVVVFLIMPSLALAQMKQGLPGRTFYEPGTNNYIIDFTEDPEIKRLWDEGKLFENGALLKNSVNMAYDSRNKRFYAKSFSSTEERDPVDQSMIRTPEAGHQCLTPWTTIGQNGARSWGPNGPMHYGGALLYLAMDWCGGTVAPCIGLAPGKATQARYSGMNEIGQHLMCNMLFMPSGDIAIGYDFGTERRLKVVMPNVDLVVDRNFRILYTDEDPWKVLAPNPQIESLGREWMKHNLAEKID